jgi:hypothetical protein
LPTLAIALYLGFVARMLSLAVQAQARLTVGADGVLLATHAFRRTTFYPYATIVDVRRDAGDIVIGLASGESLRLGIGGSGGLDGGEAEREVTAALARIAEARAAYASAGASSDVATVLARGDRDVGSWSAALKALLGDARTYRTPAVPPETLWRVLEDPRQPATARAGAAVALRGTLDDEARGRLRVATATCASAELRGAFEAAAEADDETVETALRAFKAEAG